MKLPGISDFIGKKSREEELFVAFVIGKNWVQAGLWQIRERQVEVIASGTTDAWHDTSSFVQVADDSLASTFGGFPSPPAEVHSVVFGLPNSWVQEGNVAKDKLEQLRTLCEKLELKPAGFVVIPESIIHFLKGREGTPISCILVGIEEEELEVILVRASKMVSIQMVSRSISLADDITEGLTRFGVAEPLPARLIIYNRHSGELDEATQNLLTWEWPFSYFLHTPRVEAFSPDLVLSAVVGAAASEIAHVEQKTAGSEISTPQELVKAEVETGAQEFGFKEVEEAPISEAMPKDTTQEKEDRAPTFLKEVGAHFLAISYVLFRARFAAVLLTIALGFGLVVWFLPKAQVVVYVTPKRLEETLVMAVDPTRSQDTEPNVVPGRVVSAQVSGEKTVTTTGTRTVGDRAKGELTIFNNTSQPRTFQAGTVLAGPNGLKFTLDSPISVASESGAPNYTPGSAKGAVTATDIGAEYNLEAGTIFPIANFATSSFSGKNDSPFTGGASQEVAAVRAEDQKKVEEELMQEFKEKVTAQIGNEVSGEETAITESVQLRVIKRIFSAEIGAEAQSLNANLTAQGTAIVVAKKDMNAVVASVLKDKIPEGFLLEESQVETRITPITEEKETDKKKGLTFQAKIVANLLPKIDQRELAQNLRGKSLGDARTYLANVAGYTRSTIKFSLPLPIFSSWLPQRASNITIKIAVEQ